MEDSEFKCDSCHQPTNTLYEGYFYATAKLNPFAQGTASAGLLQLRRLCKQCVDQYKELGLHASSKRGTN